MKRGNDGGAPGGGKKMRGDTLTLRFLVQSKHAGGIIGKGGQTIKRLRTEYNATVNVPDSNSQERVLSIGASQDDVMKIVRECLPLFHEPPYSSQQPKGPYEIDFLVHSSQVGGIIGRAGSNIKELRETTNTNIKVFTECLTNSTERVVALGGGEEEIIDCLNKILVIMQEFPIKGNIALYDPSNQDWNNQQGFDNNYNGPPPAMTGGNMRGGGQMRGGRGGGGGGRGGGNFGGPTGGGGGNYGGPTGGGGGNYGGPTGGGGGNFGTGGANQSGYGGGAGGYGNNNYSNFGGGGGQNFGNNGAGSGNNFGAGDQSTTQVTIPNDLAGAIIGKGGERIRNIRQRSGADIKIADAQPGKNDRVITIAGSAEQIQYGQFLMQQSVRQYSGNK